MKTRLRRLRKSPVIRGLAAETSLSRQDLIAPIFVVEGRGQKQPVPSMPNVFRYSVDRLENELSALQGAGVRSVLLFGVPDHKDWCGSEAYNDDGVVQRAIRRVKELWPEAWVIADVCMCEYTDHGHCGILDGDGSVNNDKTLPYLAKIALSCVRAGADMVAPSDMMDGHVAAIRQVLDDNGFESVPIMGYSAKYASNFYGPFRAAAGSAPSFGDRRGYQMDYRNTDEALREVEQDVDEGADVVMVKPALVCLDVLRRVSDAFPLPLAAYLVSGEYAMIQNAIDAGLLNPDAMYEAHIALKRAGADMIITYAAKDICGRLER